MANIDSLVTLIKDLRQGQLQDDVDPNNTVLNQYASPYDQASVNESVRMFTSQTRVWGDGTTYTAYDSNGNPWQAPSCGWLWGSGGQYTSKINGSTNDRYSDAVMKDKPLAYYRLDDTGTTAVDFTGNGNNGTLYGGVTTGQTGAVVPTVGDTSMKFDGSSGYIQAPPLPSMPNVTAEVWFYPTANQDANDSCIVTDGFGNSGDLNFSMYFTGSLTLQCGVFDGSAWHTTPVTLTMSAWNHIVMTYDGATLNAYLNGSLVSSLSYANTNLKSNGSYIRIGRRWDLADYVTGYIDEVAIYGYALSASQIAGHYNAR